MSLGHAATLVQGSDVTLETEHVVGQGWFLLLPLTPAIPAGVGLAAGIVSKELGAGFVRSTDGVLFCVCRLPEGFTQLRSLGHLALNDVSLQSLPNDIGK